MASVSCLVVLIDVAAKMEMEATRDHGASFFDNTYLYF
jgi:hypothetical protein